MEGGNTTEDLQVYVPPCDELIVLKYRCKCVIVSLMITFSVHTELLEEGTGTLFLSNH